jgi:hypothetical protein
MKVHIPDSWVRRIARPDTNSLILTRAGDVTPLQNAWAPSYISHPVTVSNQWLSLLLVTLARRIPGPELHQVVRAASDEPPLSTSGLSAGARDEGAGARRRRPAHAVHSNSMGLEDLVVHAVVLELQHRHVAVGRGAGEQAARLVGRPGQRVYGSGVQSKIVDACPLGVGLAPDEDLAVV